MTTAQFIAAQQALTDDRHPMYHTLQSLIEEVVDNTPDHDVVDLSKLNTQLAHELLSSEGMDRPMYGLEW